MACSTRAAWVDVPKHMLMRILFPNPVCALTTRGAEGRFNVMTISWLTAVNNSGMFLLSMNQKRHSFGNITKGDRGFTLGVPVAGMEDTLLAIGGCSGANVDKIKELELDLVRPWAIAAASAETKTTGRPAKRPRADTAQVSKKERRRRELEWAGELRSVGGCVAYLGARVVSATLDGPGSVPGHAILLCKAVCGRARADYWDGRCFGGREGVPPILTFLGTKTFGYVGSRRAFSLTSGTKPTRSDTAEAKVGDGSVGKRA